MASSLPKVRSLSRHFTVDPDVIQQRVDVVSRRSFGMDSVRKGDALLELAQEHSRNFVKVINGQKMLGPDRVVTIGTGCTGSAADAFVFEAIEEAYREYLPDLSFEYKFNCESNEKKREWIVRLHDALHNKGEPGDSVQVPCMFGDVTDLGANQTTCHVHDGQQCVVPSVDIFVCCTSCKDFSKQNNKRMQGLVTQQTTTPGALPRRYGERMRTLRPTDPP